jgi:GT2 family glycosyltransferase
MTGKFPTTAPVSIMITTRNRSKDLHQTLGYLSQLTPQPAEILITADGCEDQTAEMVSRDFPNCKLTINRIATSHIILSLDDDSYPNQEDFLAQLPAVFESHPEASVVTFPELRDDNSYISTDKSPTSPGHYVSAYPNGAAAMLREQYLATSGFPHFFTHAYEEPDYALQTYSHGKAVWFEPSLTIRHHYSSTNRNMLRTHHLNARNELWSVWMRCPSLWLVPVSIYRVIRQFAYAASNGARWLMQEPLWWYDAIRGLPNCFRHRSPIAATTYLGWMRLARRPLYTIHHLQSTFPSFRKQKPSK